VIGESRGLGSGEVRAGAAAMVSVRAYVIERERESNRHGRGGRVRRDSQRPRLVVWKPGVMT
jgi:hypothetical protein